MALKIIEKQLKTIDNIFKLKREGDYFCIGEFPTKKGSRFEKFEALNFYLNFPTNYPFSAPSISFVPFIFHPNINNFSELVLQDFFKEDWCPAININSLLNTIWSIIDDPVRDCPVNELASEFWDDENEYNFLI